MSLNHVVSAFARRRSGALVLGGIAAVLDGVERLMAPSRMRRTEPVKDQATPMARNRSRNDFFTIKRTQSDLGFTYWVLQGHGVFASFELFDTWSEAVSGAQARLAAAGAELLATAR